MQEACIIPNVGSLYTTSPNTSRRNSGSQNSSGRNSECLWWFQIALKVQLIYPCVSPNLSTKFHDYCQQHFEQSCTETNKQTNKKWKYYSPPLLDIIIGSTKCNTSQSTLCLLAIDLRNGPALKSLWLGRVRVWPCTTDWVSHLLTQIDLWTQRHPAY